MTKPVWIIRSRSFRTVCKIYETPPPPLLPSCSEIRKYGTCAYFHLHAQPTSSRPGEMVGAHGACFLQICMCHRFPNMHVSPFPVSKALKLSQIHFAAS